MEYVDFELDIAPGTAGGYALSLNSPAGEAKGQMQFPFGQLELRSKIQSLQIALLRSGGTRRSASPEDLAVEGLGRDLFNAAFAGDIGNKLQISRAIAGQRGQGVRIKLRISAPELVGLPWEYLFDEARGDYLALAVGTPVVRYVPLPIEVRPLKVTPPIRILGMTAGPRDLGELDVATERQRLQLALEPLIAKGLVQLEWVPGERWEDLQQTLWQGPWHVFHFIGHGGFSPTRGGVIYLSNEKGFARQLSATDVGRLLGDHDPLRLAVLNSCETAQGDETDIFSSTAATLVRRGTPAVVAMQFQITDVAAIQFGRVFYAAIAYGMPVDAAVAEARKSVALHVENSYEWGTPVLFMRSPDGVLFTMPEGVDPSASVQDLSSAPITSSPPSAPPSTGGGPAAGPQFTHPFAPQASWTAPMAAGNRRSPAFLTVGCVVLAIAVLAVLGFFGFNMIAQNFGLGGTASIYLSSTGGPSGSQVNVSGTGFGANETVTIRFHTTEVGRTTANSEGAFTNVRVTVPAFYGRFAGNQFEFVASGESSIKSATAPYVVSG